MHHVGHNPAGAVAILALLGLAAVVTGTRWLNDIGRGGEWLQDIHDVAANLMLALVGGHVAGVLPGSWMHRENLIDGMVQCAITRAGAQDPTVQSADAGCAEGYGFKIDPCPLSVATDKRRRSQQHGRPGCHERASPQAGGGR